MADALANSKRSLTPLAALRSLVASAKVFIHGIVAEVIRSIMKRTIVTSINVNPEWKHFFSEFMSYY